MGIVAEGKSFGFSNPNDPSYLIMGSIFGILSILGLISVAMFARKKANRFCVNLLVLNLAQNIATCIGVFLEYPAVTKSNPSSTITISLFFFQFMGGQLYYIILTMTILTWVKIIIDYDNNKYFLDRFSKIRKWSIGFTIAWIFGCWIPIVLQIEYYLSAGIILMAIPPLVASLCFIAAGKKLRTIILTLENNTKKNSYYRNVKILSIIFIVCLSTCIFLPLTLLIPRGDWRFSLYFWLVVFIPEIVSSATILWFCTVSLHRKSVSRSVRQASQVSSPKTSSRPTNSSDNSKPTPTSSSDSTSSTGSNV